MEIKEGGILALANTTSHNFGAVTGKGTIQMEAQTTTFGAGTSFSTFVQAGGGTFELINSSSFTLPALLNPCNNLIINNTSSSIVVTLMNNLTIRGNFMIQSGTFQINNNASTTALVINLDGNLEVGDAGKIRTGSGNANGGHSFNIKGDFTNEGNVWFSNLSSPQYQSYPATGYVHAIFNNTLRDQRIICNDTTKFYRIEIAKGIDKTFVLNIDAANSNYFKLFGNNFTTDGYNDTAGANNNALGLEGGTCRLGNNIVIPCLTTSFYFIKDEACLWIDGGQVVFKDADYPIDPSTGVNNCGLYVYGTLKLSSNGSLLLNAFSYRGMVLRGAASVEFHDNSVLSASMIRTSANGAVNRGAFVMDGNASVTFTGNTYDGRFATFDLGFPDNLISMGGGVLNILNPTTSGGGVASGFSLRIASESRNINITGGTVFIELPSNIYINSTAPFWDLTFNSATVARTATVRHVDANAAPVLTPQPLRVNHNLTLSNYAELVTNNTNGAPAFVDVMIGGNFNIQSNARYTPGNNTTVFNGTGGQIFLNTGNITNNLYNLAFEGSSNTSIDTTLTVRNTLTIGAGCILNDVGNNINVSGNILNNGIHSSQAAGRITLNGTSIQTIGGSGQGVFGNIIQNNTSGIAFAASQTINGDLRLPVNAPFNIGIYNLSFAATSHIYSAATGSAASFSSARMITTTGNESDGGITKIFNASNSSFVYPFGVTGKYTPARISVNSVLQPMDQSLHDLSIRKMLLLPPRMCFLITGKQEVPDSQALLQIRFVIPLNMYRAMLCL